MAARELYDYLANGNIKNSVNFPDATLERMGVSRVCILHQNVPTMLNQFLEIACSTGLNVENMINKAYGAYAYAMMDLNGCLDDDRSQGSTVFRRSSVCAWCNGICKTAAPDRERLFCA